MYTSHVHTHAKTTAAFLCVMSMCVRSLASEHGYQAVLKTVEGQDDALVGPGSLRVKLLDYLHMISQGQVQEGIRISQHTP
jgi:hypothetical protein